MKRFLLFASSFYYPNGGWDDFIGSFDTVEGAVEFLTSVDKEEVHHDWYQVVDTITFTIVARSGHNLDWYDLTYLKDSYNEQV